VSGSIAIVGGRSEGQIAIPLEQGIGIAFTFVEIEPRVRALAMALANHGREVVLVPWDQVSLTGPDMVSRAVVHGAVDAYGDSRAAGLATVVPPGGSTQVLLFPMDLVVPRSRGWGYSSFFERIGRGEAVLLYLPIRIGTRLTPLTFRFVASIEAPS
jgi:hypothetical protein